MQSGKPAATGQEPGDVSPLLFAWEPARNRRRIPRRLLILLAISAVGHVGSFYGLQVLYTTPAALPPVPAQITILKGNSPESVALEKWLSVADPALAISATNEGAARQRHTDMPALRYSPSFASGQEGSNAGRVVGPASLLDELDAAARAPAARSPALVAVGPGVSSRSEFPAHAPPRAEPVTAGASTIVLSDPLRRRLRSVGAPPQLRLAAPSASGLAPAALSSGSLLQPTVLLVYLAHEGEPPVVFLQSSSGQASPDEAARNFVTELFAATPRDEATWGEVTVFWGRDAYR